MALSRPELPYIIVSIITSAYAGSCQPAFAIIMSEMTGLFFGVGKDYSNRRV